MPVVLAVGVRRQRHDNTRPLLLGRHYNTSASNHAPMSIDNFALWDESIADFEIQQLAGGVPADVVQKGLSYKQRVLADSPTAYWRLEETSGSTAYDAVGPHNGAYTEGNRRSAGIAITDRSNNAAELDGNTHIDVNEWYHLGAVKDGTEMLLYLNGELDNAIGGGAGNIAFDFYAAIGLSLPPEGWLRALTAARRRRCPVVRPFLTFVGRWRMFLLA